MKEQISMSLVVKSAMGEGADKEEYVVTCRGQLRMASGVNSLTYTEEMEGRRVHTTLTYRLHAGRVHLKKRGAVKSEMVFEEGFEHVSIYEMPPYRFDMTVLSRKVKASLGEDGGEIVLVYMRTIGGDTTQVTLTIAGTPVGEDL